MKINVESFGPIEKAEFELSDFSIFIGKQASGKSTLSKLMYYFMNIRDEVYSFIIESLQQGKTTDIRKNLDKRIKKRFVEFFGPTVHDEKTKIIFNYNSKLSIELTPDIKDRKYISNNISEILFGLVVEIIKQNSSKFSRNYSKVKLFTSSKSSYTDLEIDKIQKDITLKINNLFGFSYSLLFIPAGRSILSTLSDQLQNIHPHLLDFPMMTFIDKVVKTKAFFNKNIDEIIRDKEMLEHQTIWHSKVRKSKNMISKIVLGNYIHDESGGKIVVKNNKYVKINFTSSGQQESIWIVLSLFLIVLEKEDVMVFIEEPEAHLFPDGQKDVIDFIIMVRNLLKTKYVITTHSPYILSALNNSIYGFKLKNMGKNISDILDDDLLLDYREIQAYKVENGTIESIVNNELELIDVGEIDDCSKSINIIYSKLEDVEFANA